jgi:hypothetical protein
MPSRVSGALWARPSICQAKPTRALSRPHCQPIFDQPKRSTNSFTVRVARWKTESRRASSTCLPIALPLPRCGQSVATVVRLVCLRDARSIAPCGTARYRTGRRNVREPAPEAPEDRRAGTDQCAPIHISMASSHPYQAAWRLAQARLAPG